MLAAPACSNRRDETFDEALTAANQWLQEHGIRLHHIETVVLPNIWSRWEEGQRRCAGHQRRSAQPLASVHPLLYED